MFILINCKTCHVLLGGWLRRMLQDECDGFQFFVEIFCFSVCAIIVSWCLDLVSSMTPKPSNILWRFLSKCRLLLLSSRNVRMFQVIFFVGHLQAITTSRVISSCSYHLLGARVIETDGIHVRTVDCVINMVFRRNVVSRTTHAPITAAW